MPRAKNTAPTPNIFPDKDQKGLDPYTVIVTTLNRLEDRLNEVYTEFKETSNHYATKQELSDTRDELMKDIDGIHEWATWATRLMIGAVLLALAGWILSGGLAG